MPSYGYKVKTTRTQSPHGTVIIVHFPLSTRIAQVYQGVSDRGGIMFYCFVMSCFSPELLPEVERVPAAGGVSSIEELEEMLCSPS